MKVKLRRAVNLPMDFLVKYNMQRVNLEGEALIEFLRILLTEAMAESEDPDLRGRTPDKYLENLQNNRLGNFSKRYVICAYEDSVHKPIGILLALPETDGQEGYHILTIGVVKAFRRKGVGKSLIKAALNVFKESEIKTLVLDVHRENKPALELYKELGFKED